FTTGVTTGQNYQFSRGYVNHGPNGGSRLPYQELESGVGTNPWNLFYTTPRTTRFTSIPINGTGVNTLASGLIARPIYYNYRMNWMDASIQGVINLNNVNFYKEQNKGGFYATAGAGFMGYNTYVDALKLNFGEELKTRGNFPAGGQGDLDYRQYIKDNTYSFENIKPLPVSTKTNIFNFGKQKNPVWSALDSMRGVSGLFGNLGKKHYESRAETHTDEQQYKLGGRTYIFNPFVNASAGVLFRISRRMDIGVEHRIAWTNDDLLDGQRWQEHGATPFGAGAAVAPTGVQTQQPIYYGTTAMTRDFDAYHFTALVFNLRLGPGEESMWWQNPLAEMYGNIADTRKIMKNLSEDSDGDSVPDMFDKDPETPEGTKVDVSGRPLDSDDDGYPDSQDRQPFSLKDCPVDNNGKMLDSDNDQVPDCLDTEPNSPAGAYVDATGRAIKMPTFNCDDCMKDIKEKLDGMNKRIEDVENKKQEVVYVPTTPTPIDPVQGNTNPPPSSTTIQPCNLPSVHFDADRSNIKQDFYPAMYYIGKYMTDNPNVRVKIIAHNEGKSGDKISKARVQAAINFLTGQLSIDRGRFIEDYSGTGIKVGGNMASSKKQPKDVPFSYLNRRLDFECVY
ncbi:MAG: hypothetical protein ACKVTZ_13565, partial [Bacteroidia bacterium]